MGWRFIFSSLVHKKLLLQNWKNNEAPNSEKLKKIMKYYLDIEKTVSEDRNKHILTQQQIFETLIA